MAQHTSVSANPTATVLIPAAQQLGQTLQSLVATPEGIEELVDESSLEPAPTLGTRTLNFVINCADLVRAQMQNFLTGFSAVPELSVWFAQQTSDQRLLARWTVIGETLLASVGVAGVVALMLECGLFVPRAALRRRPVTGLAARLATVFALFGLRALPLIVFVGLSIFNLNQADVQKLPRFIIMNVIYAIAASRILITIARGVLSPTMQTLRFLPLSDQQARYGYHWFSAFSLIVIYGYFLGDVAHAIKMPTAAMTAFGHALGLILVAMLIALILQNRAAVANLLRGRLSATQTDVTLFQSLRLWLARHWHRLAIAYLVIGYAVAALGVEDGLTVMLRGTLLTLLILLALRLLFAIIDRQIVCDVTTSVPLHHSVMQILARLTVTLCAGIGLVAAWGVDVPTLLAMPLGQRVVGSVLSIGATTAILVMVYEWLSRSIDRHLNRRTGDDKLRHASARARTLLPLMRHTLFIVFAAIIVMLTLSEAGFNIAPLLAGAGVVGVAIGFGSQTLIKDFLIGLFIVVENTIAIGDSVKLGEHSGTVEAISIRTIRLRDLEGALHSLPFSEVGKISNMSKDFSYALVRVGVALDTDIDTALAAIRAAAQDLQQDPIYQHLILQPVEIMGVDNITDTGITLMARLRTRPAKHWEVRRMFLLHIKQHFDQAKIKPPFATVANLG